MKGVKNKAITSAQKATDRLLLTKLPLTDEFLRQLAWIAFLAESPEVARWVKDLSEKHAVRCDQRTLLPLLRCFQHRGKYQEDEAHVHKLLGEQKRLPAVKDTKYKGKEMSSKSEDPALVDGVYVDPDEPIDFTFTRVEEKRRKL